MLSERVPVNFRVPAAIVVFPVYEFDAASVKIPVPFFLNAPAPDITPETVSYPDSPVVILIQLANSNPPDPLKDWIVSELSTS